MQLALMSLLAALSCTPALDIGVEGGNTRHFALGPDGRFSVTYWHSMYDVPFSEDFTVGADRQIHLTTVRSDYGGPLEYLRLEGEPGTPQAVARAFASIPFRVATGQPQTLHIGARSWSFREFGAPGARIVLTPASDCPAK